VHKRTFEQESTRESRVGGQIVVPVGRQGGVRVSCRGACRRRRRGRADRYMGMTSKRREGIHLVYVCRREEDVCGGSVCIN
jgi:hypothetical protein